MYNEKNLAESELKSLATQRGVNLSYCNDEWMYANISIYIFMNAQGIFNF